MATITDDAVIIEMFRELSATEQRRFLRTMTTEWLEDQPIEVRNYFLDALAGYEDADIDRAQIEEIG